MQLHEVKKREREGSGVQTQIGILEKNTTTLLTSPALQSEYSDIHKELY